MRGFLEKRKWEMLPLKYKLNILFVLRELGNWYIIEDIMIFK